MDITGSIGTAAGSGYRGKPHKNWRLLAGTIEE